ncbi:MAG: hypothetical protein CMM50_01215 [Rhodospirillaceae bacterium]|nr:hypothetical protein [Rhodospirillaceae bacterium]
MMDFNVPEPEWLDQPRRPLDFDGINRAALASLPSLLRRWLPDGRKEAGEYVARNPCRNDRRPGSFKINLDTGAWADFATDDRGGDVVSLLAYLEGLEQGEAARRLAGMVGLEAGGSKPVVLTVAGSSEAAAPVVGNSAALDEEPSVATEPAKRNDKTPIIPAPDDAPPMNFRHPKHGLPSRTWEYRDGEGRLYGYAARFDFVDADGVADKEILPVTFCALANGRRGWRSRGIPDPRPLYRLPELLARPEAWVIVCEGEKAADAAADLFPDCVTTSPMHGAKSPHLTDWSPLCGRQVFLSLDNDDAGRAFGDAIFGLLTRQDPDAFVGELELPSNYIVRDGQVIERGEPVPEKWDIADALTDGWTPELVEAERAAARASGAPGMFAQGYLTAAARAEYAADSEAAEAAAAARKAEAEENRKQGFQLGANGVYRWAEGAEGDGKWTWLCSMLEIDAATRSEHGEEWGRLLIVTDLDGRRHPWAMPMSMVAGDGTAYRERLFSLGLRMAAGKNAREALHRYLNETRPKARARCVGRIGWHGSAFILPDAAFGSPGNERTILQSASPFDHAFKVAGALDAWQKAIAAYAVGNSRLAFSIAAAFAAPLLAVTDSESGGFHFRGASSIGKSTALVVAGSVWGGGDRRYIRSWRATDNGLEAVALGHCDALLCLDELSQVDARTAGSVAYMLANGAGKSRAGRGGEARVPATWRTLFLSNGEIGISDKMMEDGRGRRATAGQQVRVVDIPADAGAGLGLFDALHGFASGDALARHLKDAAGKTYGVPARAFLQAIADRQQEAAGAAAGFVREFVTEHCPSGADGQVSRVAARFGLVAAAGELATGLGILPWPAGEAVRAAARCFGDWLTARGGTGATEIDEGIAAVRRFIEQHGESRFTPWGAEDDRPNEYKATVNRAGFRRYRDGAIEFYVFPEAWRTEVLVGFDFKAVNAALIERGILLADKDQRTTSRHSPPGVPAGSRFYHLSPLILGGGRDG